MKSLLYPMLLLWSLTLLIACGDAPANTEAESTSAEETTAQESTPYTASFFLKNERQEDGMAPTAQLWVRVNERELLVTDISGSMDDVPSEYWDGEPIPADVLAACVVHYGESDYYYVLLEDGNIVVKNGYTVESPDTGTLLVDSKEMLRTPL